jgi:tetratricopeptide (TPR) repeat protein
LAQKLRFKLAVLLSDEKNARASLEKLKALSSVDHDLRKLVELFEAQGVTKARDFLMDVYKRQGIQVKVPTIEDVFLSSGSKIPLDPGKQTLLAFQIEGLTAEAEQFTVTSLENIAKHIAAGERGLPGLAKKPAVELDSTTLAEIYAKQGYYAKARDVYKRLLTMSPENEQLKLKYADMTRLERGQTSTKDIEHEQTETADRLAQVDIINRQMRFYQNLLEKL